MPSPANNTHDEETEPLTHEHAVKGGIKGIGTNFEGG